MDINDILIHLGENREDYFNAVTPPIIQSSNFVYRDITHLRHSIADEFHHHIYTRGNNPTVEILRKKIAALEHAEDALIVGSGASAIAAAVLSQVKSGDHIICINKPYSWTYKLISQFLSRFNIDYTFVESTTEAISRAIRPQTKVLMLESPNSLTFEIQDLKACSQLCKQNGITSIIDNSHCSPYFQNPIDFGIDIVVHSATKYLCGQSDVVMGVICSSSEIIEKIFIREFMTLGLTVSPNDAFLAIRGLRTFELRMQRVESTGQKVWQFLKNHPKIRKVYYPLDPDNSTHQVATSQMRGCGGLISLVLDTESKVKVEAFSKALDKFLIAVSWGGHESLQMPSLVFHDVPGTPDSPIAYQTVRLYCGLEDPDYLITNLETALHHV